jgi:hypothetical protein
LASCAAGNQSNFAFEPIHGISCFLGLNLIIVGKRFINGVPEPTIIHGGQFFEQCLGVFQVGSVEVLGVRSLSRFFYFLAQYVLIPLLDASDWVETVKKWNAECALAEKFQRLVAVKRMVEAGANVAEQPFERQPLKIRRSADGAKRQVDHAN